MLYRVVRIFFFDKIRRLKLIWASRCVNRIVQLEISFCFYIFLFFPFLFIGERFFFIRVQLKFVEMSRAEEVWIFFFVLSFESIWWQWFIDGSWCASWGELSLCNLSMISKTEIRTVTTPRSRSSALYTYSIYIYIYIYIYFFFLHSLICLLCVYIFLFSVILCFSSFCISVIINETLLRLIISAMRKRKLEEKSFLFFWFCFGSHGREEIIVALGWGGVRERESTMYFSLYLGMYLEDVRVRTKVRGKNRTRNWRIRGAGGQNIFYILRQLNVTSR